MSFNFLINFTNILLLMKLVVNVLFILSRNKVPTLLFNLLK
nr:MAG TPA: hypothetical protein [Caudoviricetes sp.]